ncbi:MAG: hypothetical protein NZ772_16880 [Cyanobacteria bacterium]|nr:hypothetical protein [Cyanobacteriota bacterium]MDW8202995.1 hypothetical protein [Cyanobacteriota bacterium SKYGB_h_bin112]
MNIEFPSLPRETDLNRQGIEILIESMGAARAAIFISNLCWQSTNYLAIKDRLFAGETIASLYEKVVQWRDQSSGSS